MELLRQMHILRPQQQRAAGDQEEPQPDRHAAEDDQFGDLAGGYPQGRVDPVAGGTAPDDRGVIAEGVPDKGGEGELVIGQRVAGVPQGQGVVGGQDEVVEDRQHHGVEDIAVAHLPELADDIAVVIAPQLMVNEADGQNEQADADRRTDSLEELTLHDLHSPGSTTNALIRRGLFYAYSRLSIAYFYAARRAFVLAAAKDKEPAELPGGWRTAADSRA